MLLKIPVKDGGTTVLIPVNLTPEGNKLAVSFDYCPALVDEFKNMSGARWMGFEKKNPRKIWVIDNNKRNQFRLDALRWLGKRADGTPILGQYDPYARYQQPLLNIECNPRRYCGVDTPYYKHQPEGVAFIVTRRQCILAWDPGTGKSLVAGTAMEWAKRAYDWKDDDFYFICKKAGLFQVQLDFMQWEIGVHPHFMSYQRLVTVVENWPKGKPAPKFIVFDESTMIKSATAKRTEMALYLANAMRDEWGPDAFVVLMTGTPAPKNPTDWWAQGEVACPGFIREGDVVKFKKRLAVMKQGEREDGGIYTTVGSWRDDEKKCKVCGEMQQHNIHAEVSINAGGGHEYQKGTNEVLKLDSRLKGFVSKKKKSECMDLPEKVYKIIRCRPIQATLNAAKIVAKAARGAADALTRLRELSDGFQYVDAVVETVKCSMCGGNGLMKAQRDPENPDLPISEEALKLGRLEDYEKQCDECDGAGEVPIKKREVQRVPCPKDDVLEDLLDENQDVGRLPIYCGFRGTVDRVVQVCLKNKWHVIRVDGRGWTPFWPDGGKPLPVGGQKLYELFRFGQQEFPMVVLAAQATTAAHALNFDCAPMTVYYSRDFQGESAMQGDERAMRGRIKETLKKHNRQCVTIVDICHLPSDDYVLENIKKKRKLQAMTLGEVQKVLDAELPATTSED